MVGGLVGLGVFGMSMPPLSKVEPVWGVTFSIPQAVYLGLDWQEAYAAVLDELGVRHLRLSAYWNRLEPVNDGYDWSELDYQMDHAAQRGASVLLAVGRKLPRWPECHDPAWIQGMSQAEVQEQLLETVRVVVERYRDHAALRAWQLENEPLFAYGECPPADREFLRREEELLRQLDGGRHPIVVTDSGELSSWWGAAQFGDVLGTTMYRTVFSQRTGRAFHYDYIFPAGLYRLKARYIRWLVGKPVVISELQGEPWGKQALRDMTVEERRVLFSPARFRDIQAFAEETGLPEAYWWGVEFWYWEKVKQANSEYWEIANEIF